MTQDAQLCGNTGCDANVCNNDKVQAVTVEFAHNQPTMLLTFETDLNQPANDESWGISDFQLTVFPCDPLCSSCSGPATNQCQTCSTDGFMYAVGTNSTCVKNCPDNSGMYGDLTTHTC